MNKTTSFHFTKSYKRSSSHSLTLWNDALVRICYDQRLSTVILDVSLGGLWTWSTRRSHCRQMTPITHGWRTGFSWYCKPLGSAKPPAFWQNSRPKESCVRYRFKSYDKCLDPLLQLHWFFVRMINMELWTSVSAEVHVSTRVAVSLESKCCRVS